MIINIFEECLKCQKDFFYFAETYLKIVHPKKGLIPLALYDFQKRLVKDYEENRFVCVKKFRGGGFSTTTILYGLWKCLFQSNQKFLILSKTDREARYAAKIVQNAIDNLPEQFSSFLTYRNDHTKKFQCTESEMQFISIQAFNGRYFTHLIIEEPAFISNMEEHWKALWPLFGDNKKCFVLSTVNGIGNWFYDIFTGAVDKKNTFKPFECMYTEHPEYNEDWCEQMKKSLGEKGWHQEILCCFIGSEQTKQDKLRYSLMKILNDNNISEKDLIKKIIVNVLE